MPPSHLSRLRDFCSNDYLGLGATPGPSGPTGAGGSRLVSGDATEHVELERELTAWLGLPACLSFTSGYAANLGTVSALAGPDDLIVSDQLSHASLVDGARLSRARIVRVPHCDLGAVARALESRRELRALVLTESYFSMDADGPDLRSLRDVCTANNAWLLVDEAHALGVLGPAGRGLCADAGVVPDVLVGTFGKAFGAGGAFVAGSAELVDWLWNRARSFVFSTGLSPALADAARRALAQLSSDDAPRSTVLANAHRMRRALAPLRPVGFGQVIPCIVGDPVRAVAMSEAYAAEGIHVQAIRPPSVPAGTARLRFTASANHDEAALAHLERATARVLGRLT